LGEQDKCVAAFKSALLVQPEAKLPVKVAPKVTNLFESVRTQVKRELAAIPSKPSAEPPKPAPLPAAPPTVVASQAREPVDLRQHALIPAIAGGALVVAGGICWAVSRGELSLLRNNDPGPQSTEDVQHIVSKGRTTQTLGVTLLGVGTAGWPPLPGSTSWERLTRRWRWA
jgi:hypothetical protein